MDRRYRRLVFGAMLASLSSLVLAPPASWAGALTCLTGTDPSVTFDLLQITTVRGSIASSCVCATFDGTPGKAHSDYVKCAKAIIATSVAASKLRTQCKGTVTKYYSTSTCGFPASQNKRPCIQKTAAGKVSCSVKPRAQCAGTSRAACPAFTTCIDAGDLNHDGLIEAPGDSGACAPAPQIANGDFECANLSGWTSRVINGGFAALTPQGTCFGANNTLGLTFDGTFAVNLRSNAIGTTDSVGILTSLPFEAGQAVSFRALSENSDATPTPNPVVFEVSILDSAGSVLLSQVLETNIVTLAPGDVPYSGCTVGDPRDGTFSSHTIDTSAFADQVIRVEFRQHTNSPGNGFFTLVDDVMVPGSGPYPPCR